MTKQNINTGSSANDGTGDTLRAAAIKVNANFQEIYTQLGGNTLSALVKLKDSAGTGAVIFEGSSADSHETTLIATNATADRIIQIPNATGIIVLKDTADTLTNKTLTTPTITTPVINAGAQLKNGSTSAGFLEFFEDTDNGTNKVTLIGPASTADVTITLPAAADTLVGKATTDTLTNKTLTSPVITLPQINDTSSNHKYTLIPGELSANHNMRLPVLGDSDTIVFSALAQTLTNKTLTSPKIGTSINDTAGLELIKFTATGSAINELTIANGASAAGPALSATGGGANLNITLASKGTGSVSISKAAYGASTITANGNASIAATLIICNKSSALAVALLNGTTTGEFKIFSNKGSGLATVTPASFANGTSFALTTNHATQCIWDGAKWFMLNGADSSDNGISIT